MTTIDNIGYAIIALQLAIVGVWLVPVLLALFSLRRRNLDASTLAIWVLIILAVPYLGALAYWIMRPGQAQVGPANDQATRGTSTGH